MVRIPFLSIPKLAAMTVIVPLVLAASGAWAGGVEQEVKAASMHAGFAAGSTKLETVHAHLHHVVNCLVSPDDPAFDKSALNPCKGIGTGAIADATDQKTRDALQSALEAAKKGLQANNLDEARNDARQVADMLKSMKTGGK